MFVYGREAPCECRVNMFAAHSAFTDTVVVEDESTTFTPTTVAALAITNNTSAFTDLDALMRMCNILPLIQSL